MTVAFLLPSEFNPVTGIWQKVLLQAEALQQFGAATRIFSFSSKDGSNAGQNHFHIPLMAGVSKESQLRKLCHTLIESSPDVVYLRRELWHPCYKNLMRRVRAVAEINTDESREFRLTMPLLRRWYAALTHSSWEKHCSGFVAMTGELARTLRRPKPVVVIPNGIAGFRSRTTNGTTRPHLFFSCTGGYQWHGIDKFVEMARLFPNCDFSFAGDLPPGWNPSSVPKNLVAHGRLSAIEADGLLHNVTIGVGTLALHRKGMTEACPLKVRSYLSFGLPTMIAYHDTDFSNGFPFICQLPNEENNILAHKGRIEQFVNKWSGKTVSSEQLNFATETEKATRRLDFFRKLLSPAAAQA